MREKFYSQTAMVVVLSGCAAFTLYLRFLITSTCMSKVLKNSFFLILFLLSFNLHGQIVKKSPLSKKEQQAFARTLIQDLNKGVLLVRLNFHQNQINYFRSIIEDQSQPEKDRKWARTSLNDIESRRDTFNIFLRAALDSVYRFSEVRYIYDKDYNSNDPAENEGNFLNKKFVKDPSISIGNKKFLLLIYTNLTLTSGQSKENFRIVSPDFTDVPEAIQIPGSGILFNIKSDIRNIPQFKKAMINKVRSYQEKLDEYYSNGL